MIHLNIIGCKDMAYLLSTEMSLQYNSPSLLIFSFSHTLSCMEQGRFPNRLRMYRRMHGYSQKKVAKLLGFSTTAMISRWELGIALPTMHYTFHLAQLYQVLPHELYPRLWKKPEDLSESVSH